MNQPASNAPEPNSQAIPDFLTGGGELGARMRSFAWETTPLGPPASWPQSLTIAVRIMLASRQPIWIGWGNDLHYLYNDAYKSIMGGKHPWALGRPAREVWHEIWDEIGPMLATALRGDQGTYVESQFLIMERNGYPEETYYTFSYSPVPNDDGTVGGIICANSDDTQRVIGERQLALLRDLAADAGHARTWEEACERSAAALSSKPLDIPFAMIYVTDPERGVANLAGMSGIAHDHPMAPRTIAFAEPSLWPVQEVLRSQRLKLVSELEGCVAGAVPAGPWRRAPSLAAVVPIPPVGDTGRAGVLIVGLNPFRLFDEGYQGFLGLVAAQIGAAIGNGQAYEEERRRAEALAEIDRAKTTFFSNVSHEFRTPLSLMLGPIEDVLNDASKLAPHHRDWIETAHRNSLRLLKLVNSLLDFSRIEAGRADASFEPIDLARLTVDLASNFQSVTRKAGLALRIDCPALDRPVHVDRDMWEKIVLNLVSNAFKFTFEGEIAIELRESADRRFAELCIRDTGVGIPASELSRLFERFHRIEGQKGRSFEGSGIGLALVHELVKLHGGTIRVESAVGEGSAFTISLPYGTVHLPLERVGKERTRGPTAFRAEAFLEEALRWLPAGDVSGESREAWADDSPGAPLLARSPGARILIADDNLDMRGYLRRLLGSRWEVAEVADGRAALEAIRARKPDLLLTDVMMPRLDGFGLLRELRRDPGLQDIPVIVLSARAGEEARVEGLDAGADDYLTKPFSARELIARVNANLEMARVRREATRKLRESETRFRNMADHAPVMMWVTDPSGSITYMNRLWHEFTGQSQDEALGFGAWETLHPEDRERSERVFFEANAARSPFHLEFRLRRSDGAYRWSLCTAGPRFSDGGDFLGYIGSVLDIEDRKRAEEVLWQTNEALEQRVAAAISERAEAEGQLRQAQKMEAVGALTGGIAHDFNNVLQVISANLQLLAYDTAGDSRARQRVQTAIAAVFRGAKLSSQLLAFGRRQPLEPKVLDIGRRIRGIGEMLRRTLGEGVEIATTVDASIWNAFVDAAQLENALLNLAINARDAMNGSGTLTIEAANAHLDERSANRPRDVSAGDYVMIAVSDTGCGIAPHLIERVFEPFFTTKPEGKGTGLGLSMVYGFVKQSGGHTRIESELGRGTTVRIFLPRSEETAPVEALAEPDLAKGGDETVLVVEDDEGLRETVADMLSALGYRVLKAKDAQSALEILESNAHIDLLFTDVVMPGTLRGPELAKLARQRLPGIAVLFTSGYAENAIVHGGRLDEGIDLLSKPYTREAMARKIRHVLRNQKQSNLEPEAHRGTNGFEDRATCAKYPTTMPLHILLVEDDALIRLSTADMLTGLGHRVTLASGAGEAVRLLESGAFDLIMTDLALADGSGEEIAVHAAKRYPGLRTIFATGLDGKTAQRQELEGSVMLRKPYDEQGVANALEAVFAPVASR